MKHEKAMEFYQSFNVNPACRNVTPLYGRLYGGGSV